MLNLRVFLCAFALGFPVVSPGDFPWHLQSLQQSFRHGALHIRALSGDPEAQFQMGLRLSGGGCLLLKYLRAIEQESIREIPLLKQALENKSWRSDETFTMPEADLAEAVYWYEKAAGQGHAAAAYELARLLGQRAVEAVQTNFDFGLYKQAQLLKQRAVDETIKTYNRAIGLAKGSGPVSMAAHFRLAQIYQSDHVRQRSSMSLRAVRNLYEVAYSSSRFVSVPAWVIGKSYEEYKDYEEAIRWYKRTEESNGFILYRMGICFLKLKKPDKAIPLLNRAMRGYAHMKATVTLGTLYLVGAYGIPEDVAKALGFYHKVFLFNRNNAPNLMIAESIAQYDRHIAAPYFKKAFENGEISERYYNSRNGTCESSLAVTEPVNVPQQLKIDF